jgi:hypothetical protein
VESASAVHVRLTRWASQAIALRARHSRATRRSVHRMVGNREDSTSNRMVQQKPFVTSQ